jgi:hypothetical protein
VPSAARLGAALLLAALAASAQGQSVTLAWDASPGPGIAGYRLYVGGSSGAYSKVIEVGNVTSNRVSGLVNAATYFFAVTAYDTNNVESDFSDEICFTVPSWSVTFAADSGTISTPLVASNGKIDQPVGTGLANGGEAAYSFNLPNAGNYVVSAMVLAPSEGQNSFYVNIDGEPTDPLMIWDIPIGPTLTNRTVTWRGDGSLGPATAQFGSKVFTLSAGKHQLIIRGREANTILGAITITAILPQLRIKVAAGAVGAPDSPTQPPRRSVILDALGQPGQMYSVLCSQDLRAWSSIGTLTLDETGLGEFTDPAGTSQPSRMYRLQSIAPPTLQIQAAAGGPVVLSGTGQSGLSYYLLCSPDLKTWTPIGTVTISTSGSFIFTDPAGSTSPGLFYRLQGQ